MSIEALIQAHTEALTANTEAVKLLTLSLAGRTPAKSETKTKEPAAKAEEKKEEPVVEAVEETPEDGASTAVPYETVRALVLKLAPTQREAIKALNASHGLTNAKDMLSNPDDFTSVKDQAKLEAYYADLLALEA
jgi:hypothetical protein